MYLTKYDLRKGMLFDMFFIAVDDDCFYYCKK